MHNYSPSFNTLAEFIAYLEDTLLPDLRESGSEGFVQDFEEAIYWMEMRERIMEDENARKDDTVMEVRSQVVGAAAVMRGYRRRPGVFMSDEAADRILRALEAAHRLTANLPE